MKKSIKQIGISASLRLVGVLLTLIMTSYCKDYLNPNFGAAVISTVNLTLLLVPLSLLGLDALAFKHAETWKDGQPSTRNLFILSGGTGLQIALSLLLLIVLGMATTTALDFVIFVAALLLLCLSYIRIEYLRGLGWVHQNFFYQGIVFYGTLMALLVATNVLGLENPRAPPLLLIVAITIFCLSLIYAMLKNVTPPLRRVDPKILFSFERASIAGTLIALGFSQTFILILVGTHDDPRFILDFNFVFRIGLVFGMPLAVVNNAIFPKIKANFLAGELRNARQLYRQCSIISAGLTIFIGMGVSLYGALDWNLMGVSIPLGTPILILFGAQLTSALCGPVFLSMIHLPQKNQSWISLCGVLPFAIMSYIYADGLTHNQFYLLAAGFLIIPNIMLTFKTLSLFRTN